MFKLIITPFGVSIDRFYTLRLTAGVTACRMNHYEEVKTSRFSVESYRLLRHLKLVQPANCMQ